MTSNFKFLLSYGLIALLLTYSHESNAKKWIPIPVKELSNFVIDEASIEVYPGSVSFISRYAIEKIDVYHRNIFLCGSSEIYGIDSKLVMRGNAIPDLTWDISDRGLRQKYNNAQIKTFLSKRCGGQLSRTELEVPITLTSDEATFILARSAKISKRFVSTWEKSYKSQNEDLVVSGEKVIVDGKPLFTTKLLTDRGYTLRNYQYDCDTGTFETLGLVEYDGSGKVKNSFDLSNSKSSPSRLIPGSIGMTVFDYVCGLR